MFKRIGVLVASAASVSAWHPLWTTKPSWFGEDVELTHSQIAAQESEGQTFPLHPRQLKVIDYKWSKIDQRAQVETDSGAVYFRRYIAQEVFASQLAEFLDICVAKSRYIPWGSAVSHAWQDVIQDVTQHITPDNEARVQYLFEDQVGVQEIEFIDGAVVEGYQAKHGYDKILFDIGKLFAFDIFINDPHNCRFCQCNQTNGHYWTCRDKDTFHFIISPAKGVCGYTRAYKRLDVTSEEGVKFRQFFQIARSKETTTELAKQMAYVVGEMFGENLTMDRREAAEMMLKGSRFALLRLLELSGDVFHEIGTTSGLHQTYADGLSERLRMVRMIVGEEIDKHDSDSRAKYTGNGKRINGKEESAYRVKKYGGIGKMQNVNRNDDHVKKINKHEKVAAKRNSKKEKKETKLLEEGASMSPL